MAERAMSTLGYVLIIDDEEPLRHSLTRVLKTAGCEVLGAADGLQALQFVRNTRFDLVYLDIHLPGISGLDVLQTIRAEYPDLPVILFTGHASLQSALDAIRLGATDYLVKPIDPDVLVARTRVILEEQKIERRKRELREELASLRAELRALAFQSASAFPEIPPEPQRDDRFLKRGDFVLDLQARRATLRDRVLSLPPTAFAYLMVLARHAPEAVDYQTLVTEAQGYAVEQSGASELAKYHIHILRQAINVPKNVPGYILNVRGIGYRLLVS
ncbi:MAG TPA: response regulator transcription factor [Anaerolineales bacterium]|nr:response regulator transcription factor [Anaerolineales bacterium]